ncbi:MAG: helix-turn-helix transcriptional regulator [Caulobacterales bacterium]
MNLESKTPRVGVNADRYVCTKEAARVMTVSHRTLEDWRVRGCGPVYRKLGRAVRYSLADLAAFMDGAALMNTGGAKPA